MRRSGTFIVHDGKGWYLYKAHQKYSPNVVKATWSDNKEEAHKFSTWNAAWVAKQKVLELDGTAIIVCINEPRLRG